ncbi:thiamine biosynthesis protein ThiS [Actinomadura craniellae]|uniref:Thiamine biosynthesis protein ThiS n=1 Tax=Actinomadura craniellae TaxID=2231787 RepID=A0A365H219_9ACTN|nr:sulfur carrier protein ThiS [Actinomadura craniellae]RAY13089.1 thiamine biosynthesis protein ThiS [Actinomadura craniellae]
MQVIVNGTPREVPAGTTVAALVSAVTTAAAGVAAALNDEVVPRALWTETAVREADRLEVLTAVQGG